MEAQEKIPSDTFVKDAAAIAGLIANDQTLCLAPDYSGCAIAVIVQLIRRGVSGLNLLGVPQLGLQADMLIGAGCVRSIDAAAVTLGEFGQAPRFVEAFTQGSITMHDSTCPVIHAGLQAAEKGIPFMPLRGILGSDLVTHRPDWKVLDNPFKPDTKADPILLVPALNPDITLMHAPVADRFGNVWVGIRRELLLMAHAARRTLITVDKTVDHNLLDDARTAAGVIPSLYVSAIAEVPRGAAPVGLFDTYPPETKVLASYAEAAKTADGFDAFMRDFAMRNFAVREFGA